MFSRTSNNIKGSEQRSSTVQGHQPDPVRRRQTLNISIPKDNPKQKSPPNASIRKSHHPISYQSLQKDILRPKKKNTVTFVENKNTDFPSLDEHDILKTKDQRIFEFCLRLEQSVKNRLRKLERYDKNTYKKECEDLYHNVINREMKRIEQIKNSNRSMRLKHFDNQVTITFIHNLLRLVNEIEYENLKNSQEKRQFEEEQKKRRQFKFQTQLEEKRGSKKFTKREEEAKKLIIQIDNCSIVRDESNLISYLREALDKYSNDEIMFPYAKIYRILLDALISKDVMKKQESYLSSLVDSLTQMNQKGFGNSMASLKEQRNNIKESVNNLIPRKYEDKNDKSQRKRSPSQSPEAIDYSTRKLLKNLDSLEQLYDLIIYNYESQYEHKRSRKSRLLVHKSKLHNLGSMSPSVLVVDEGSIWGSRYSGNSDKSIYSRSKSKGNKSIKKIRMTFGSQDEGKNQSVEQQEYFKMLEKQITVLKNKLDEYSKKEKDVSKFTDKIQELARKIQYQSNPCEFMKKAVGELKIDMPFMTINISTHFIKIFDKVLNASSKNPYKSNDPPSDKRSSRTTNLNSPGMDSLSSIYSISSDKDRSLENKILEIQKKLNAFTKNRKSTVFSNNTRKTKFGEFQRQQSMSQSQDDQDLIGKLGELILEKQKTIKSLSYKRSNVEGNIGSTDFLRDISNIFHKIVDERSISNKSSDEKRKAIQRMLVSEFRKNKNIKEVQIELKRLIECYEVEIKNQGFTSKGYEHEIKKLEQQIQRQRKMNEELKKSLKLAQVSMSKKDTFEPPSHSDTNQLKYIEKVATEIQKGGEWWNRLPRKLKRHDSFAPVYGIIEMLKQKEIQLKSIEKTSPTKGEQESKKKLQNQLQKTKKELDSQRKMLIASEDRVKSQQKQHTKTKNQISKYEKLRTNSVSKQKQLSQSNQSLRQQIIGLKKKLSEANQGVKTNPMLSTLREQKGQIQRQFKQLTDILKRLATNIEKMANSKNPQASLQQIMRRKSDNTEEIQIYQNIERILESWKIPESSSLKQLESRTIELQRLLATERKLNGELRKTAKIPNSVADIERNHTQSRVDLKQFDNINEIYRKIEKGGEWWTKIPRRLKRNDVFSTIYAIIELLKEKQIQLTSIKREPLPRQQKSPKNNEDNLKKQIEHLKSSLERQQETYKKLEDKLKAQRAASVQLNKKVKDVSKYNNIESRLKVKEEEVNELRRQNDKLRAESRIKTITDKKSKDNELKNQQMVSQLANYQSYAKFLNNLTRKSKQYNVSDAINELASKETGSDAKVLIDIVKIIQKQIARVTNEAKSNETKLREEKEKVEKLLENQKTLNISLKKIMPQNISESHFDHPSHSDAQELAVVANIEKKIREGGDWWKKLPRKIRRHDSFTPVYNIIEMLKDKQLENRELNGKLKKDEGGRNKNISKPKRDLSQSNLQQQNTQSAKKMNELKNQVRKLETALNAEQNKNRSLMQKQRSTQKQISDLRKKTNEVESPSNQIKKLQNVLQNQQNKNKSNQEQIKELKAKLAEGGDSNKQIKRLEKALQTEQNRAKSTAQRQKVTQQEVQELRRKMEELQRENNGFRKLENALQIEKNKNKNISQRIKDSQQLNNDLRKKISELQNKMKLAIQENPKNQNVQNTQDEEIMISIKESVIQKQRQLDDISKQLAALKAENEQLSLQLSQKNSQSNVQNLIQSEKLKEVQQKYKASLNSVDLLDRLGSLVEEMSHTKQPKTWIEILKKMEDANISQYNIYKNLLIIFTRIHEKLMLRAQDLNQQQIDGILEENQYLRKQIQEYKEIIQIRTQDGDGLPVLDLTNYSIDSNKDINKLELLLANLQKQWQDKYKSLEAEKQEMINSCGNELALKDQQIIYLIEDLQKKQPRSQQINELSIQTSSILLKPMIQQYEDQQMQRQGEILRDKIERKENIIESLKEEAERLKNRLRQIQGDNVRNVTGSLNNETMANLEKQMNRGKIQYLEYEKSQLISMFLQLEKETAELRSREHGSLEHQTLVNLEKQMNRGKIQYLEYEKSQLISMYLELQNHLQECAKSRKSEYFSNVQTNLENQVNRAKIQYLNFQKNQLIQMYQELQKNLNQGVGNSQNQAMNNLRNHANSGKIDFLTFQNKQIITMYLALEKEHQALKSKLVSSELQIHTSAGMAQHLQFQKSQLIEMYLQLQKIYDALKADSQGKVQSLQIEFYQQKIKELEKQQELSQRENFQLQAKFIELEEGNSEKVGRQTQTVKMLEEELDNEKKEKQQLINQLAELEGILKEKEILIQQIQHLQEENRKEMELLQQEVTDEKIISDKQIEDLSEQLKNSQQACEKQKNAISQLESELGFENQNRAELQDRLKVRQDKIENFNNQLKSKDSQLAKKKQDIDRLEKENSQNQFISTQRQTLKAENQRYKLLSESKQTEIAELKKQIKGVYDEIFALNLENQELKKNSQIQRTLESTKKELQRKNTTIREHNKKIQQLQKQLEQSKERADFENAQIQNKIEKLNKTLANKDKQIESLQIQKSNQQVELEKLNEEIFEVQSRVNSEASRNQMSKIDKTKEKIIDGYKNKISLLEKQVKNMNSIELEKQHFENQLESVNRQLEFKEKQVKKLNNQLNECNQQIHSLRQHRDNIEQKYQNLDLKIVEINTQRQYLNRNIDKATSQIKSLKKQLENQREANRKNGQIQIQRDSLKRQLQSKERNLEKITKEYQNYHQNLEEQYQAKQQELVIMKDKVIELEDQLRTQKSQSEYYKQTIQRLRAELQQRQKISKQLVVSSQKIEILQREITHRNEEVKSVTRQAQRIKKFNDFTPTTPQEANFMIQQMQREIQRKQEEIRVAQEELDYEKQLRNSIAQKLEDRRSKLEASQKQNIDLKITKIQLERELANAKRDKNRDKNRLQQLQNELAEIIERQSKNSQLITTINDLQRKLSQYSRKIEQKESEQEHLSQQHERLIREKQEIVIMIQKRQKETEYQQNEKNKHEQKFQDMVNQIEKLTKTKDILQFQLRELREKLREQENQFKGEIMEKDHLIDKLKIQIESSTTINLTLQKLKHKINQLVDELQGEKAERMKAEQMSYQVNINYEKLEKENSKAQQKVAQKQEQLNKLQCVNAQLSHEIQNKKRLAERLREEANNLKDTVGKLKQEQEQQRQQILNTRAELQRQQGEKAERQDLLKRQHEPLKEKIKEAEDTIKNNETTISNYKYEIDVLRSTLDQSKNDRENLERELQDLKNKMQDSVNREIKGLKTENQRLRPFESKVSELILSITKYDSDKNQQNQQLQRLKNDLHSQKVNNDRLQQDNQQTKEQLVKIQLNITNKDKQTNRLKSELNTVKEELASVQQQNKEIRQKPDLEPVCNNLKRQVENKEKVIKTFKENIAQLDKQINQLRESNKGREGLEIKVMSFNQQVELKDREIKHLKDYLEANKESRSKLQEELEAYREKEVLMKSMDPQLLQKQISAKDKQIAKMNDQLRQNMKEIEELRDQLSRLKNQKLISLQNELKHKQREKSNLKKQLQNTKNQLADKQTELNQLCSKLANTLNFQFQIDGLKRSLRLKEKELEKRDIKINYLQKQIDGFTNDLGNDLGEFKHQRQLDSKDRLIDSLKKTIEKLEKDLNMERQEVQQLRNNHDRLLDIEELKRELSHNIRMLENQKKANKLLEQQLEEQRNQSVITISPEVHSLKLKLDNKQKQIDSLKKTIESLRSHNQSYKNQKMAPQFSSYDFDALNKQLNHTKKLLENEKKVSQTLRTEISEKVTVIEKIKDQYVDNEDLGIIKTQLSHKTKETEGLLKSYKQIQIELQKQRQEKLQLRRQQDLTPEIQQLKRELAHNIRLLQNQKKANQLLEDQLEQQRAQYTNTTNTAPEIDILKRQMEYKDSQIKQLQKIITSNNQNDRTKILNLQEELYTKDKEIQSLKHEIKRVQLSSEKHQLERTDIRSFNHLGDLQHNFNVSPQREEVSYSFMHIGSKQSLDYHNFENQAFHSLKNKVEEKNQENMQLRLENRKLQESSRALEIKLNELQEMVHFLKVQLQKISPQIPISPGSFNRIQKGEETDRSCECEGECSCINQKQLEIIKKINLEVSDLAEINQRLQVKIQLIEQEQEQQISHGDKPQLISINSLIKILKEICLHVFEYCLKENFVKQTSWYADLEEKLDREDIKDGSKHVVESLKDLINKIKMNAE